MKTAVIAWHKETEQELWAARTLKRYRNITTHALPSKNSVVWAVDGFIYIFTQKSMSEKYFFPHLHFSLSLSIPRNIVLLFPHVWVNEKEEIMKCLGKEYDIFQLWTIWRWWGKCANVYMYEEKLNIFSAANSLKISVQDGFFSYFYHFCVCLSA